MFDKLVQAEFTPIEESKEPEYEELPKSPYPTPEFGGRMLKEGRDECYEDEVYVWFHLTYDGFGDLELEPLEEDSVNSLPRWWYEDLDCGVDSQLIPNRYAEGATILKWAMETGIIHEQPFAVCVSKPEWYRCSYEYNEYDCDYSVDVVRIGHPRKGLKDLERILAEISEYPIWVEKRRQENILARWEMTERMVIRSSSYFPSGQHYHDMAMPRGYEVGLYSTLSNVDNPESRSLHRLVSVRSDEGDQTDAWRKLENKVAERRPDLVPDAMKAMRHHHF